jgi:2-oxoglutarate dehydrogenase E2 component (dihydrolipoamide succinyltransferase)
MPIELKVPSVGESITEVEIGAWKKSKGESVEKDGTIVVIESEKATVELPAPVSGVLTEIRKQKGQTATVGEVIGLIEEGGPSATRQAAKPQEGQPEAKKSETPERVMPAAQRALAEAGLRAEDVKGTGPGGRVLKEDVQRGAEAKASTAKAPEAPKPESGERTPANPAAENKPQGARQEEAVPMSRLRRTLAERLVEAQQTAALLTTFNEVDMTAAMTCGKNMAKPSWRNTKSNSALCHSSSKPVSTRSN